MSSKDEETVKENKKIMYFQNNNVNTFLMAKRSSKEKSKRRSSKKGSKGKKKAKDGGTDKRKGGRRADISHAGTKRILAGSAARRAGPKVRVSKDATDMAQDFAQDFIGKMAREINKLMSVGTVQTVQKKHILAACETIAPHCCKEASTAVASKSKDRSELSDEGVRRQAKKDGLKHRMSEGAKIAFRGAVVAYVRNLGDHSGCIVHAARRRTVKDRDIEAAQCN
uniref:Histone-like protein n=1 Tax=Marseillevirus LCMAC101 TaxID=2506602 RepID=A0A481YSN9_9VIRU|nr:MAG: histone-like protein [Marseillevirus LCMAC101]